MMDLWRSGRLAALGIAALGLAALVGGCDSGSDGTDGPTSQCLYGYGTAGATSDFGVACTSNADCQYGVCMQPGDKGNITNAAFGFCTRGCDCDDSTASRVSGDDEALYSCAYPGGCFVGQSKGGWRHVVPRCTTLADCTAIDSRYTLCGSTSSSVVFSDPAYAGCGQLDKVCQAE
jgi:hypothetical protein